VELCLNSVVSGLILQQQVLQLGMRLMEQICSEITVKLN